MDPAQTPPATGSHLAYRATLAGAVTVAAVAVVFFVIGLADGSVSSFNMALWIVLLGGLGAILWAGFALRARGHARWAIAVLGIAAVPGLIGAFLMLLVLVTQPRWN